MEPVFKTKRQLAKERRNKEIAERYLKLKQEYPTAPNRVLFSEKMWKDYDLCPVQIQRIVIKEGVYDGKQRTNIDPAEVDQ